MEKINKWKTAVLVVLGMFVAMLLIPISLAAPNWTETGGDIADNGSFYIDIDSDNSDVGGLHDERFAIYKHGAPGTGTLLFVVQEDGKVGIGDADPECDLDITSSSVLGTKLELHNIDTGGERWQIISTGSSNTGGAGKLMFYDVTSSTVGPVFTGDGKVGIGTTIPDTELHVDGNIKQKITTSNVANPPTDAQLDTLFGLPASNGDGWTAYVKDSSSTNFYQVVAVGTAWYTFTAVLAV